MKINQPLYIYILAGLLYLTAASGTGYCIAPDKKLHLGAGIIIGAGSYFICPAFEKLILEENYVHPALWSIGMASLAGAGKEIVYDDMMGRGYADVHDFYYTAAGGAVSGLTLFIIESIFDVSDNSISIEADPFEKKFNVAYRHFY